MTLHDTCPIELKDSQHLVRLLHVLVSEESKATEQYEQLIAAVQDAYPLVKSRLEEIRRDELNHTGILIRLISELDESAGKAMVEGAYEGK